MEHTQSWKDRFDREFGFDKEYLKTLPATLPKEDVGLLIRDIKVFFEKVLAEERAKVVEEVREKLQVYSVTAPEQNRAATFTPEQFISLLK